MGVLTTLFVILLLISPICLVIGLFKPSLFSFLFRRQSPSRKYVVFYFSLVFVLAFLYFAISTLAKDIFPYIVFTLFLLFLVAIFKPSLLNRFTKRNFSRKIWIPLIVLLFIGNNIVRSAFPSPYTASDTSQETEQIEGVSVQNTQAPSKEVNEAEVKRLQQEEQARKDKEEADEKTKQQEAEKAKKEKEALAGKKRQDEEKTKKAQAEEKLNSLATQYCSERKQTNRYYPLPETKKDTNGKTEYEIKNLKKRGSSLTQSDCRTVIDYMTWFSNEYVQVAGIDIQKVIERKYWIGMNVAELMSSVGWPDDINKTNYGIGSIDQWIYYKDSYGASAYYIYVENSKVTSYQDF